jgi:NADH:ubiquinone oxidoreductase subunit K
MKALLIMVIGIAAGECIVGAALIIVRIHKPERTRNDHPTTH